MLPPDDHPNNQRARVEAKTKVIRNSHSVEVRQQVLALFKEGLELAAIERMTGVSYNTLLTWHKNFENGVFYWLENSRVRISLEDRQRIAARYLDEGKSIQELAKIHGVNFKTLQTWVKSEQDRRRQQEVDEIFENKRALKVRKFWEI